MLILVENLPDTISEEQFMQLISRYDRNAGIKLIENLAEPGCRSCLVTLTVTSHAVANTIATRLDGLYWQGVQLSAHRLLFG
jgi:hypothetical protein